MVQKTELFHGSKIDEYSPKRVNMEVEYVG